MCAVLDVAVARSRLDPSAPPDACIDASGYVCAVVEGGPWHSAGLRVGDLFVGRVCESELQISVTVVRLSHVVLQGLPVATLALANHIASSTAFLTTFSSLIIIATVNLAIAAANTAATIAASSDAIEAAAVRQPWHQSVG